jgi:hypothetical protein
MSRYPWAQSFIKKARYFSIFIVLFGLAFIGLQGWNLYNQIDETKYRPNPELTESLLDLSSALQKSRDIISDFQASTGSAPIPQAIKANIDLLPSYDSVPSLAIASDQLTSAKDIVSSLKQFLLTSVQQNLDDIVRQLREHAASVAPASNADNSNASTPSGASITTSLRGLFAEEVTPDEAEQRKAQLEKVQDLLKVLIQRTEKPENQNKLQSSVSEIGLLEGLLAYLTVPAEITTTTANLQPGTDQNSTPQPEMAAAKVADLLEASEGIAQEAVTSNWLVDEKISLAEPIIIQEQKEANQAADDIKSLYINFYEKVFIILLVTVIVAYLVQIAADILQAHIDNADNSFQQPPPDAFL